MGRKLRILLSPGYHAEVGETKGHQHDVYTTVGELHGYKRIHVGALMKSAVDAWANASGERAPELAAENKRLRAAVDMARSRLMAIRDGEAFQPHLHAAAGLDEISDLLASA